MPGIFWFLIAPTVLAFLGLWYNASRMAPQPDMLPGILGALEMPTSYRASDSSPSLHTYVRIKPGSASDSFSVPNVSAIVLNWSRFPNVLSIVSVLCSHALEDIISDVVVWNNNPRPLSHNNFRSAACASARLKIINSPENVYFQARFIACADSKSAYCFVQVKSFFFITLLEQLMRLTQDDDYVVRPEIIRALYSRAASSNSMRSIHLLPPHEYMSSRALTGYSVDGSIHTSFAWLGHGTIIRRSQSSAFLSLMNSLGFSEEEKRMADNYFTILHNEVAEIWFDQGIDLGGGQPFTVGIEGEQRNRKHIHRATEYLKEIISSGKRYDYVSYEPDFIFNQVAYATCTGIPCVLSSHISSLDRSFTHLISDPRDLSTLGSQNLDLLTEHDRRRSSCCSLSCAVDGDVATYFTSPYYAKANDSIMLDMTTPIGRGWSDIEMVFVANRPTTGILLRCTFESSADGETWVSSSDPLTCHDLQDGITLNVRQDMLECSVRFSEGFAMTRYFRLKLANDTAVRERWEINEIWVRGNLAQSINL